MKKTTLLLALTGFLFLSVHAQNLQESKVPAAVKSAFMKAHPNMKGEWEKEGGDYEVNFKMDGKSMSSVINKAGAILSTETELTPNELPQSVQTYLAQHYKGAKIKGAAKIIKDNGEVCYEAGVNGKEFLFDSNGKMLKKAKEEKD